MSVTYFVDTNIFVYAHDGRDVRKQKVAAGLLRNLAEHDNGVTSTQVVQEFCNAVLRPGINLPRPDLSAILQVVLYPMLRHTPSMDFYERALKLQQNESLSFYDALIVQAAIDLGCQTLYSEDLQDGRVYGSLNVKNPFR